MVGIPGVRLECLDCHSGSDLFSATVGRGRTRSKSLVGGIECQYYVVGKL